MVPRWVRLEVELHHGRRAAIGNRHLLRLLSELLVSRLDGVGPGRQPAQLEGSVFFCHREERIRDDVRVGVHPAMQVTFEFCADERILRICSEVSADAAVGAVSISQ
jgi:hypothetical protein